MHRLLFAVAACALASPALADPKPADPDKLVCHRSADTGSRLRGTRQCLKRSEWARLAKAQESDRGSQGQSLDARPGCSLGGSRPC